MMRVRRKIIEIDEELCNGCGQCVPACAEGALEIVAGKARVVGERYCDGLGACLGECPTGALKIVEREAEDFDAQAVEELLASRQRRAAPAPPAAPPVAGPGCACAGSQVQVFSMPAVARGRISEPDAPTGSALTHWPVQIRLVPPTAPYLRGAHLLVAADCVPVAYPAFHQELLAGKVVMVGCPKFDDRQAYVEKFSQIFASAGLAALTVAVMEVPCCGGMRAIVQEALARAGSPLEPEVVVVGARGHLLSRRP